MLPNIDPPRSTCPLCGNSGDPMTMEHLIPTWAGRILRRRRPGKFQTVQETLTGDPAHRDWQSDSVIDVKFRVCRACNEFMGSRIEEPARRIVAPMLTQWRIAIPLDPSAQLAVARWITKVTLLGPLAGVPRPLPLRRGDWAFLCSQGRPTNTTHIWIGAYTGASPVDNYLQWANVKFLVSSVTGEVQEGVLSTLVIGHLAAQTLTTPTVGPLSDAASVAFRPDLNPYLASIWPANPGLTTWPPPQTLDAIGIGRLALGGEVDRRPRRRA